MNVVFASDGSPGALKAAEFLSQLRLTEADTLFLLAVVANVEGAGPVEQTRAALGTTAARVEIAVRTGSAPQQIVEFAREAQADLIALGAMGETGLARFFIGSVAERVLRYAQTDVLIARPVRFGLRRALIGVDPSPFAEHVVEVAAQLPLPAYTETRLVSVMPARETILGTAFVSASLSGDLEDAFKAEQEERAQRLRALAAVLKEGEHPVAAEILRGDPATQLLQAVDREEADLLIVGSQGEGGVDHYLLGSVSERVARHAHSSVLVVR